MKTSMPLISGFCNTVDGGQVPQLQQKGLMGSIRTGLSTYVIQHSKCATPIGALKHPYRLCNLLQLQNEPELVLRMAVQAGRSANVAFRRSSRYVGFFLLHVKHVLIFLQVFASSEEEVAKRRPAKRARTGQSSSKTANARYVCRLLVLSCGSS